MIYSEEVVQQVRDHNDIVEVLSGYMRLQPAGSDYKGLCPFHNEKHPSFSVKTREQYYKCFGCGKGGNVITFVRDQEGISYTEAIELLAERAGITLPKPEYSAAQKEKYSREQKLLEINKEAAIFYYKVLRSPNGEIGLKYFTGRKLSDETMKSFGLGFAPMYRDALLKHMRGLGYSDELLKASGLFVFDEAEGMRDKFINRVMFPIQNKAGKVIGFGGRVMGDGKPKYLNSPETEIFDKSANLYAYNFAKKCRRDRIIVCEGYMDVIALHQAGFTEAVASLGTAFTMRQAMLIRQFTKNVYLAYDSDGAGVTAALRNIGILRDASINAKVIDMRPHKDPDEFIKNLGAEEYEKRIDNAENAFMFEIRQLFENTDISDPTALTKFHKDIAAKLCIFEDELERNNYMASVCQKYSIDEEAMKKYIIKHASEGLSIPKPVSYGTDYNKPKEAPYEQNECTLLGYIAENNGLYDKMKEYISFEDFVDPVYRKAAELLFTQLENGRYDPASIIDAFDSIDEQGKVTNAFETNLTDVDTAEKINIALNELLRSVKDNSLKWHKEELEAKKISVMDVYKITVANDKLKKTLINFV